MMNHPPILRGCTLALFVGFLAMPSAAEDAPTVLNVDVDNYVVYPGPARQDSLRNFFFNIILADVTAINDVPAKGVLVLRSHSLQLTPTPAPGAAIADVEEQVYCTFSWEFRDADGNPMGSIFGLGLIGGDPAPGAPAEADSGNVAIVGGTGVFTGVRGLIYGAGIENVRVAPAAEDPAKRRTNKGGHGRFILELYPMPQPDAALVVLHTDNTPVTRDRPAQRGEELILEAKGVDRSRSRGGAVKLDVLVNEKPVPSMTLPVEPGAPVRMRFRVAGDASAGSMTIQTSHAWIKGPKTQVPVR